MVVGKYSLEGEAEMSFCSGTFWGGSFLKIPCPSILQFKGFLLVSLEGGYGSEEMLGGNNKKGGILSFFIIFPPFTLSGLTHFSVGRAGGSCNPFKMRCRVCLPSRQRLSRVRDVPTVFCDQGDKLSRCNKNCLSHKRSENSVNSVIGTAGVVHTPLSGVKSYD